VKTFYYADGLIKIVDKGLLFYFISNDGYTADKIKNGRLLAFDSTLRKILYRFFMISKSNWDG
jgi:hypothetical protein